jgi:carbon starvation protein CstA
VDSDRRGLGGAVQDFIILVASMRRDGRSLAQMVREELNKTAGVIGVVAILSIMIILLAVLALVVVKVLAESPWGIFTVGATIPIAMFMGGYLRFWRVGKVMEVSAIGAVLLLLAVWGGQFVHSHAEWSKLLTIKDEPIAWTIYRLRPRCQYSASVAPSRAARLPQHIHEAGDDRGARAWRFAGAARPDHARGE